MIAKTIRINNAPISTVIDWVYGTSLIPIAMTIADYTLTGCTAVAYSLTPSGTVYYKACTISDNTITFTPDAGFFEAGENELQYRVLKNSKVLYTFKVTVRCQANVLGDGSAEEAESIESLLEQAQDAAQDAQDAADAAQDVLDSIPPDYSELSDTVDELVGLGFSIVNGQLCVTYQQED